MMMWTLCASASGIIWTGSLKKSGSTLNDGGASRAAKAFGLVYVGGQLARHYGVLPQGFDPLSIAKKCHSASRAAALKHEPFEKRLVAYASRGDLIRLDRRNPPNLTDEELRDCPGLVERLDGETYLMMSGKTLHRAFPDWPQIKKAARRFMVTHKEGNLQPHCRVRANKRTDRIFRFKVT